MTDQQGPPATAVGDLRPALGFRQTIGYRTTVWRHCYSEVQLALDPRHDNTLGLAHGGVYCTLLDVAFGGAVAFCGIPGRARVAVTVSLQTKFLSAARRGTLTAKGRVIAVEGKVATCEGEIVLDDGTLCATGTASFLYLLGSEAPDGIPEAMRKRARGL